MEKRKIGFILLIFLLISLVSFLIAQETENVEKIEEEIIGDVVSSNEIEVLEEEEISKIVPEEEIKEYLEKEREEFVRILKITVGTGFVIKEDGSDAQFFRGMWIIKKFINEVIAKSVNEKSGIRSKNRGYIIMGSGAEKEHLKLEKESFVNGTVKFNLKNREGEVVGNLELKPKRYEKITLWFGNLNLNAGNYIGKWNVSAVAKTKIIKPKIKKPPLWQIWKYEERRRAYIKEKLKEKLFEIEGFNEEFIRKVVKKDLRKISEKNRKVVINKEKIIKERIREMFRSSRIKEKKIKKE